MPSGKKNYSERYTFAAERQINGPILYNSGLFLACCPQYKRDNKLKFIRYLWLFLKKRHDHNVFEKFFLNL